MEAAAFTLSPEFQAPFAENLKGRVGFACLNDVGLMIPMSFCILKMYIAAVATASPTAAEVNIGHKMWLKDIFKGRSLECSSGGIFHPYALVVRSAVTR